MERALIIEDHSLMQEVFTSILVEAIPGIEVDRANCLATGITQFDASRYDIILVDLSLPDGSGLELIRHASDDKHCFIVVVTIFDDDEHLFEALRAGADGYLLKDQPKEKIISAIHGVSNGEPPLSPAIARRLMARFSKPQASQHECCVLSEREQSVLTLIAKGLRRSEAASLLNIKENTVAAHIKSIYKKLNISSRAEASIEAAKLGLISSY